jgi:hypothetical protein
MIQEGILELLNIKLNCFFRCAISFITPLSECVLADVMEKQATLVPWDRSAAFINKTTN